MIILGLSGALNHDPSAALLVDGEIVAAVEEERFLRDKHAKNSMPLESARFCLRAGGVSPRSALCGAMIRASDPNSTRMAIVKNRAIRRSWR